MSVCTTDQIMDSLVRECEKLWPVVPWTTSPLHSVPRETRKALLADLLHNKVVPPCYERYIDPNSHPISSCSRVLGLLRAAREELESTHKASDADPIVIWEHGEWPMMGWYLPWYKAPAYDMECCYHSYVLYDLLCSLTTLDDIHDALLISRDFYTHILVDHLIEMEGGIESFDSFGVGEDNIVNFVLRSAPESPPDIFERLRSKGVHMRYSFLQRNVHPRTALWVDRYYGHLFHDKEFPNYLSQLIYYIEPRSLAHLVLYVVCLNKKISPNKVAGVLRRVMPPYTPLTTALFDFLAVELESGRLAIDVETFYRNGGPGPCNQAVRVIMADTTFGLSQLFHFLQSGRVSAASDLDVDYWVLYLWKMGIIADKYQALRVSRGAVGVDMRIIDFCFRRSGTNSMEILTLTPQTVIPFEDPFDLILSNKGHKKLHVHLKRLKETCSFFRSLDDLKLFRPFGGLAKGDIDIHGLLGHCVQDLDRSIRALLHHIYTGRLPHGLDVDAIDDLNTLAGYVGNETCARDTVVWMWTRYLTRFEDHFCCNCVVCNYWRESKQG
jgi:hypothetical protein